MEVAKKITLDLEGIPENRKESVKKEVGDFVVDEILRRVSDGKSPLKGTPKWKKLDKEYAAKFKNGNRTPNLEFTGQMLNELRAQPTSDGVKVGYLSGAPNDVLNKADGHNDHSGRSSLPKRRFIPTDNEEFYAEISRGIKSILKENKQRESKIDIPKITPVSNAQASIEITDILSADLFEELINGQS